MELKQSSMPVIKKVIAISTIQDILNAKAVSKASLPETHKLLLLLSTYAIKHKAVNSRLYIEILTKKILLWRSLLSLYVINNELFSFIT